MFGSVGSVRKEISVCLVGVGHDEVEKRFTKKFRKAKKGDEIVYWENMFRDYHYFHKHWGYEDIY